MVSGEIVGCNQRNSGAMMRDVCSADIKSVEPMKISVSQASTGSQ